MSRAGSNLFKIYLTDISLRLSSPDDVTGDCPVLETLSIIITLRQCPLSIIRNPKHDLTLSSGDFIPPLATSNGD